MKAAHFYIALLTDHKLNREIEDFKLYLRDRFGAAAALKSPAHITLIPPFWMPEARMADLVAELDRFSAGQQPFPLQTQDFGYFDKRVLYIALQPSAALTQLQTELTHQLLQLAWWPGKKEERPFHPHITLATRDLRPGDFDQAWKHFNKQPFSRSLWIQEMHLMQRNDYFWEAIHQSAFAPAF